MPRTTRWWTVATSYRSDVPRERVLGRAQIGDVVQQGERAFTDHASEQAAASERTCRDLAQPLHYLGYDGQGLTPELARRLHQMIDACERAERPVVVRRTFLPSEVRLPGNDIATHLADAVEVVLFAATLGHGVDQELRRLAVTDPLGQVLFDAAATAAVERLADKTEADIRLEAAERGLYCSWRFSPGYGDLPLDVQPQILAMLNASRRAGITLTPSNLMVPTKSVTAIVGLHPVPQPGLASTCAVCQLAEHCSLRARGLSCRGPFSGSE